MSEDSRVGYFSKIFLAHTQVVHPNGGYKVFKWDEFNMLSDMLDVEIINTHKVSGLNSTLYPMKRISDKFECRMYFADTIAFMLAYALDKWTVKKNGRLQLRDDNPTTSICTVWICSPLTSMDLRRVALNTG